MAGFYTRWFSNRDQQRIALFERDHGYTPNLQNPRTFSEKLLKRIMSDDDPHYALYATKLAAPFFLAPRAIEGLHFARRYGVFSKLSPADFADLPKAFVIKSSAGSGLNRLVHDKTTEDLQAICTQFNTRLKTLKNAQGKTDPQNCIIIEEMLTAEGSIPADLKFHCFHGPDGFRYVLQIDTDRFGDHAQSIVDEDYNLLPFRFAQTPAHQDHPTPPPNLDKIAQIARQISEGFDYVRVDLYDVDGEVYFGELTPFHQGGRGKVTPREWDDRLGEMWTFRMPAFGG